MPCPACRQPLVILELEGIELDFCPACGGTWLDTGELEAIAERAGVRPGGLSAVLSRGRAGEASERRCLRCQRRLRLADIPADAGTIRIDRCPDGHGLWLDKGELRQLVDAGAGPGDAERQAIARFFADALRGVF